MIYRLYFFHHARAIFCLLLLIIASTFSSSWADETGDDSQIITSPAAENGEIWTGSLYSSSYRVGLCISPMGNVRGALFLRRADGEVDEYHFSGTVKNNHIEAYHSSGHSFSGRLAAHDRVEGRITLKNGMRIFLEGKRKQNVLLNFDDCSPLDDVKPEK